MSCLCAEALRVPSQLRLPLWTPFTPPGNLQTTCWPTSVILGDSVQSAVLSPTQPSGLLCAVRDEPQPCAVLYMLFCSPPPKLLPQVIGALSLGNAFIGAEVSIPT